MTVGIKIGGVTNEVGSATFFYAFFSTIHRNLETGAWGERFPMILKKLYLGEITEDRVGEALVELDQIVSELAELTPEYVVWNSEDLQAEPPWGNDLSEDITDLSNYFVTSTGRDLVAMIRECLVSSLDLGGNLEVVTY